MGELVLTLNIITFRHHVEIIFLTFREKGLAITRDDVIQVKEAFKWTLQGLVAKEIGGVAVVNKVSEIKSLILIDHLALYFYLLWTVKCIK